MPSLVDVAEGRCKRLMVFMPPQEGKSERVARRFPEWLLSHPARGRARLGGCEPVPYTVNAAHSRLVTPVAPESIAVNKSPEWLTLSRRLWTGLHVIQADGKGTINID